MNEQFNDELENQPETVEQPVNLNQPSNQQKNKSSMARNVGRGVKTGAAIARENRSRRNPPMGGRNVSSPRGLPKGGGKASNLANKAPLPPPAKLALMANNVKNKLKNRKVNNSSNTGNSNKPNNTDNGLFKKKSGLLNNFINNKGSNDNVDENNKQQGKTNTVINSVAPKGKFSIILKVLFPIILILLGLFMIIFIILVISNSLYAKFNVVYNVVEWFKGDEQEIGDIAPEGTNEALFMEKLKKYNDNSRCSNGLNMKLLMVTLNYDGSIDKIYDEEGQTDYEEEKELEDNVEKRLKGLVKAMEEGNCSEENTYYDDYLRKKYIPKYLESYYVKGAENEEEQIQIIINDIHDQVDNYEYWYEDNQCRVSGGTNCSYTLKYGNEIITVNSPKVELLPCNAKSSTKTVLMTLDFEDYIKGVVYAEVGDGAAPEVQKAQAIAARSFALTRQDKMCPGKPTNCWVGYIKETNTIRMRACENDQVYCDWKNGCKRGGKGSVATYVQGVPGWKSGLSGDALTAYEENLNQVSGMVLVDTKDNTVQHTNFTQGSGQNQWASIVSSGGDYYDAIIGYYQPKYPNVNLDISANCSASTETYALGISGSTHLPITEYTKNYNNFNQDRGDHRHGGIDISAPAGTAIYAIGNATVDYSGWQNEGNHNEGFGLYVRLGHDTNGDGKYDYYSYYGHMTEALVKTGDTVNGGQQIGKVGNTGRSTGNHLHFEIRTAKSDGSIGSPIDPNPTLEAIGGGSTTDFGDPNASSSNNSTTIAGSTETLSSSVAAGRSSEDIYYNQHDYEQAYCDGMTATYDSEHKFKATISTSGCSVTSIAMAAATLNNDPSITPDKVASWVCESTNYRTQDSGTNYKIYSDSQMQSQFGIKVNKIYDADSSSKPSSDEIMEKVIEALKNNNMIIASLKDTRLDYHKIEYHGATDPGNDIWGTKGGHYVVLSSINDEGKIKVLDSANENKTGYYSQEQIKGNYVEKINRGIWIIEGTKKANNGDACSAGNYSVSGDYATWKQSDPSWGNITLGHGGGTLSKYGCAATSVAIQIARSGTKIDYNKLGTNEFNPGTYVTWMSDNGGFDSDSSIYWDTQHTGGLTPNFSYQKEYNNSSPTCSKVAKDYKELIEQGYYIVSCVKLKTGYRLSCGHWVAVDRVEGNTIYTFDPGSRTINTINNSGGKYQSDCGGAFRAILYKKTD